MVFDWLLKRFAWGKAALFGKKPLFCAQRKDMISMDCTVKGNWNYLSTENCLSCLEELETSHFSTTFLVRPGFHSPFSSYNEILKYFQFLTQNTFTT